MLNTFKPTDYQLVLSYTLGDKPYIPFKYKYILPKLGSLPKDYWGVIVIDDVVLLQYKLNQESSFDIEWFEQQLIWFEQAVSKLNGSIGLGFLNGIPKESYKAVIELLSNLKLPNLYKISGKKEAISPFTKDWSRHCLNTSYAYFNGAFDYESEPINATLVKWDNKTDNLTIIEGTQHKTAYPLKFRGSIFTDLYSLLFYLKKVKRLTNPFSEEYKNLAIQAVKLKYTTYPELVDELLTIPVDLLPLEVRWYVNSLD